MARSEDNVAIRFYRQRSFLFIRRFLQESAKLHNVDKSTRIALVQDAKRLFILRVTTDDRKVFLSTFTWKSLSIVVGATSAGEMR